MSRIFEDLELIRRRPGMFIGALSVSKMSTFLDGYRWASHNEAEMINKIPLNELPFWLFNGYVAKKYQESSCVGWCRIILEQVGGDEEKGLQLFFELLDEFREIKTLRCYGAELGDENIVYHETSKNVPGEGGMDKDQGRPVYSGAKRIYKMELDHNMGFLFAVEYEDSLCIGDIHAAFIHDVFDSEKQLDRYVEWYFGNIVWKENFVQSFESKPIVRRRYIKEDGTIGYWFI